MTTKIAITISTYRRNDGKTFYFLERCLNSIKNQTYKNYKVFLIGDKYEDENEFLKLASIIDDDKIFYTNLTYAKERDKYTGEELWCSGGVNATNIAINQALSEGFEFICHLDHDDYWSETHLVNIFYALLNNPDLVFICSKCNYLNYYIVPLHSKSGPFYPTSGDITHSATCINFSKIPIRYRDVYEEEGKAHPADADIFDRIKKYMITNNLNGYLLDTVTCFLDKRERS